MYYFHIKFFDTKKVGIFRQGKDKKRPNFKQGQFLYKKQSNKILCKMNLV